MKKKKWIALVLAACMLLGLTACSEEDPEEIASPTEKTYEAPPRDKTTGESWAIYWYLCGSDLESENQAATADLLEMQSVSLPENVTVVVPKDGVYAVMEIRVGDEKPHGQFPLSEGEG